MLLMRRLMPDCCTNVVVVTVVIWTQRRRAVNGRQEGQRCATGLRLLRWLPRSLSLATGTSPLVIPDPTRQNLCRSSRRAVWVLNIRVGFRVVALYTAGLWLGLLG